MATAIISILLIAVVTLIIKHLHKQKKSGQCSCGCSGGCDGCGASK